jgi:hypothetical protein
MDNYLSFRRRTGAVASSDECLRSADDSPHNIVGNAKSLPVHLPFIWPESRLLSGLAGYEHRPPSRKHFMHADLISGLIVGADDGTINWIDELLRLEQQPRLRLVIVVVPAGPTREDHLRALDMLRHSHSGATNQPDIRVLPMPSDVDGDCRRSKLPPTVIQSHNSQTGRTVLSIGSVGDAGQDSYPLGGLNFVFQPDDALRDAWRRWFQYVFSSAAPLTAETLAIPHLVPAQGDPDAVRQWEAFEQSCRTQMEATNGGPGVDIETGEVTTDMDGRTELPRVIYNRIGAPDLTAHAPDENWNQPLSLLTRSARALRESFTDHYFPRNFVRLSFAIDDFRKACNVFDDQVTEMNQTTKPMEELKLLDEILGLDLSAKEKCQAVWRLIKGGKHSSESSS